MLGDNAQNRTGSHTAWNRTNAWNRTGSYIALMHGKLEADAWNRTGSYNAWNRAGS
jgi:hypothetical protein